MENSGDAWLMPFKLYSRLLYLTLPAVLRGVSYIPCVFILLILWRQSKNQATRNLEIEAKEEENGPAEQDVPDTHNCTSLQLEVIDSASTDFNKD